MAEKNKKAKKRNSEYIPKNTSELLPFARIEKNMFCMDNGGYMDLFRITTKDLTSVSESEVERDMLQFEKFYKMFSSDCKIIGINFPTDTKRQQQYFQHKINTTENPYYREVLQTKFEELVNVNTYYTDREYYLMIFCNSYSDYLEAKRTVSVTLLAQGLAFEISIEKKIDIITKLCNKSTSIYG